MEGNLRGRNEGGGKTDGRKRRRGGKKDGTKLKRGE